ncbi:MAG: hypothetical protein WA081_14420 [Desulfosalsimonadaceae bacterium]
MVETNEAMVEKIIRAVPIDEIKDALLNEYRRRIIRYRLLNEMMKKKYGMTFEDFELKNIVKEQDFSWQVESDAMEWEHAIEGLRYASQKLKGIQQR